MERRLAGFVSRGDVALSAALGPQVDGPPVGDEDSGGAGDAQ